MKKYFLASISKIGFDYVPFYELVYATDSDDAYNKVMWVYGQSYCIVIKDTIK